MMVMLCLSNLILKDFNVMKKIIKRYHLKDLASTKSFKQLFIQFFETKLTVAEAYFLLNFASTR